MENIRITKRMYDESKKNLDCSNVIDFINKHDLTILGKGKEATIVKLIDNIPMALKITTYNSSSNYKRPPRTNPKDTNYVDKMIFTFNFMEESNETGFEYFPYIYDVIVCPTNDSVDNSGMATSANSKIYVFYEVFDGTLDDLIKNIQHSSEWYDIIFQMAMINYYIEIINGYRYRDAKPKNILYKKLPNPQSKKYNISEYNFFVKHYYVIVIWDFTYLEKITQENRHKVESNIELLLKYLKYTKDLKIPPTRNMVKLLYELKTKPENTPAILDKYYNFKNEQKKN